MTYKKRDHPKNQGGLFFGIAFERYFYSESAVGKIAVHATPIWWSRGESIQSRVRSVEPSRTALFMRGCGELFCIYRRSPASAKQWNLPRTKKCPPDTFYLTTLGRPFKSRIQKRKTSKRMSFLFGGRGGT